MARFTYGIVVAALAALVAGFFVKTSTLPLIASIGLSALATMVILVGWGRRLRAENEGEPRTAEPEVEDIDYIDLDHEEAEPRRRQRRTPSRPRERVGEPEPEPEPPPPPRTRKPATRSPRTIIELPADAEMTYELPTVDERVDEEVAVDEPVRAPRPRSRDRVVIVPGRGRYHRSSCRFAKRNDAREVTVATARRRGYEACSVCSPDA